MEHEQKELVEAIEEGRIVKVPESYARREGLLILKKAPIATQRSQLPPSYLEKKERPSRTPPITDYIRSKPDWREKQVISELVDNFHWQIRYNRRVRGLTRKQVARMIGVQEEQIQIIESGRLPTNDFVLLNKIQKLFNINLRKDGKQFDISAAELMHKAAEEKPAPPKLNEEDYREVIGKDIEIMNDGEEN